MLHGISFIDLLSWKTLLASDRRLEMTCFHDKHSVLLFLLSKLYKFVFFFCQSYKWATLRNRIIIFAVRNALCFADVCNLLPPCLESLTERAYHVAKYNIDLTTFYFTSHIVTIPLTWLAEWVSPSSPCRVRARNTAALRYRIRLLWGVRWVVSTHTMPDGHGELPLWRSPKSISACAATLLLLPYW